MPEEIPLLPSIKTTAVDYVAAGARSLAGVVPFAGTFLGEVMTSIIPNQRTERIAQFASLLQARIEHLEEQSLRTELKDEEFTDLVEEALRQAARSTTQERREYLAAAIANSLTREAIQHSETKHLLRIMGELSDIEIIWLRFFQNPVIEGDHEFRQKHANVLKRVTVYIGSPEDDVDRAALQESYKKHLVDLGLVTPVISRQPGGNPEFDQFTGNFKVSYSHTSSLGNLLLRTIDFSRQ